jgi:eukaryotic-like serine/threonine-protein kinase
LPSNSESENTVLIPGASAPMIVGPYHLLECIGLGGMGEVWLAEQKQPVRRRVALKLIKAGLNTREIVVRFESERQALALMDHPAIAKVFDAGSTAEGLPYFVMEYVAGVPITDYCDLR